MTTILINELDDDDYTVRVYGGDLFKVVIEELKEAIPSYARSWLPDDKEWQIRSDHFLHKWLNNVDEWDGVQIEWETARHEQRHQYQTPPKPSRRDEAFATLHLLPTAPTELVKAAHKTLAFIHHPDRGGDLRTMQTINAAYDALAVENRK